MISFLFRAKNIRIQDIDARHAYNGHRFHQFTKDNPDKWLRIEPIKLSVSENLKGYYFGAVIPTCKGTVPEWNHLSDEDLHEVLKKEFNGFNYFSPLTKTTERVGRSAMGPESNAIRATEFIEKIRLFLAEQYFVDLPDPQEYKRALNEPILR